MGAFALGVEHGGIRDLGGSQDRAVVFGDVEGVDAESFGFEGDRIARPAVDGGVGSARDGPVGEVAVLPDEQRGNEVRDAGGNPGIDSDRVVNGVIRFPW